MNNTKIDWKNHSIAFLSSLLGLFIAFQIQDWQDKRRDNEKAIKTMRALKNELIYNKELLERQLESVSIWVENTEFFLEKSQHQELRENEIYATQKEIDSCIKRNVKFTYRMKNIQLIKKVNDTLNIYKADWIVFDISFHPLVTNQWQAAKSSGALSYMQQEQLALFSKAYEWIEKDLGKKEFLESEVLFYDKLPGGDLKGSLEIYKIIARADSIKLEKLNLANDQINWEGM